MVYIETFRVVRVKVEMALLTRIPSLGIILLKDRHITFYLLNRAPTTHDLIKCNLHTELVRC